MKLIFQVKNAYTVNKVGERKKTTVNVYMKLENGTAVPLTIKPEYLTCGPSAADVNGWISAP